MGHEVALQRLRKLRDAAGRYLEPADAQIALDVAHSLSEWLV